MNLRLKHPSCPFLLPSIKCCSMVMISSSALFYTEGYIVFAIGFADADYGELVSIASKPSDRHVFFVDDLDAFKIIEEKLVTFVCEAATAS